ncbi:hypothetical protein [Roseobacter denitrificans]|uniref:hypothetical protein n=1 Tax=Roseobacter denitrificans TaxID=2434 RepID=UPI0008EB1B1B|nr:hypothetical protein [Roseobacter denitrificans]SFF98289.1 hypothetical protein SAMN05443635_10559 [Roseobacter denitrificans OCh 114]
MYKLVPFVGLATLVLAACTPTEVALLSGNTTTALDIARGTGTVVRGQDGSSGFRYAFTTNGLNGLVDPSQQENVRQDYIAQFVAQNGICQNGWDINDRADTGGMLLYQGTCR